MTVATKRAKLPTQEAPKKRGRPVGSESKMFGLPVKEAKDMLVIPLLQVDIEEAQKVKTDDVNDRANFLCCVIAQGATRVCGAERVAILRRHAYVAFPGDGHTNRYTIDEKSRDVLERWDRGEPIIEGVELRLRPPTKQTTRSAHRKRNREYKAGYKARLKAGEVTRRKQRKSDPLEGVVRNGNMVRWS